MIIYSGIEDRADIAFGNDYLPFHIDVLITFCAVAVRNIHEFFLHIAAL